MASLAFGLEHNWGPLLIVGRLMVGQAFEPDLLWHGLPNVTQVRDRRSPVRGSGDLRSRQVRGRETRAQLMFFGNVMRYNKNGRPLARTATTGEATRPVRILVSQRVLTGRFVFQFMVSG